MKSLGKNIKGLEKAIYRIGLAAIFTDKISGYPLNVAYEATTRR